MGDKRATAGFGWAVATNAETPHGVEALSVEILPHCLRAADTVDLEMTRLAWLSYPVLPSSVLWRRRAVGSLALCGHRSPMVDLPRVDSMSVSASGPWRRLRLSTASAALWLVLAAPSWVL